MTRIPGVGAMLTAGMLTLVGCASASDIESAPSGQTSDTTATTPAPATDSSPVTSTPTSGPTTSESTSSAPTSGPPTTVPSTTAPAVAPKPQVGNCYDVGKAAFQQQQDGSAPVSCSQTHTAETIAVFSTNGPATSAEIAKAWRDCQPRFKNYVGDSATVSTLGVTVILPSAQQVTAGQDWIRCDAIEQPNYNGKGGRPRTGSLAGALVAGVPLEFRGCVRHWPKIDQPVHFTSCQQNHQAELIPESLTLGGPDAPYPGTDSAASRSKAFCLGVFQDYVPETIHFYYYYPTAASWKSSTHDTTCWALDTEGDGLPPI